MTHLILDAAGLHLVGKDLCAGRLRLCLMNILHQYTLVLKNITLGFLVKGVIAFGNRDQMKGARVIKRRTDRCLSIFPASRYFRSNLRRTRCRLIQRTLVGMRASAVPFRFPTPV